VPSVLTIGNFDGVHLGHRAILARCRDLARPERLEAVALTFDPPPVAVLAPDRVPPQLLPLDERIARLRDAGADRVVVIEPTADLLAQSPEQFIADLVADHDPRHVVTGQDFRFGKARQGDTTTLASLGPTHGYTAHVVDDITVELCQGLAATCRSTLVRHLVGQARFDDAARCLAQPFTLTARVVKGDQRGRTIGFPTANLCSDDLAPLILPPDGVYACMAEVASGQCSVTSAEQTTASPATGHWPLRCPAAVSIGPKPTFQGKATVVEAHLIDHLAPNPDHLYDHAITLAFHHHLRDQQPFPSLDALTAQLARDVQHARHLLTSLKPATTIHHS